MAWAAQEGRPLIPRGAGTGMPGGNVGSGTVVDLAAHFTKIGDVDEESGRIRVGAGAVADDVRRVAERAGRRLPPLPSSARWCTIGGMIANNAAGARSFLHGSVRSWVESVELVLADGSFVTLSRHGSAAERGFLPARGLAPESSPEFTLESAVDPAGAWPRVRKNASGYALDHFARSGRAIDLLIGSEGTLGFVTAATLRTAPLPATGALLLARARDSDELSALVRAAGEAQASACEFFGRRFIELAGLGAGDGLDPFVREARALVLVEVEGSVEEVEASLEVLEGAAGMLDSPTRVARDGGERERLWSLRHAASPTIARQAERGLVSMQFIEDSVVPPARLPDYLDALDPILAAQEMDAVVFGHAGDGNAHVNPLVDVGRGDWRSRVRRVLEETAGVVAALGGTLSGEHGDGRVRAPLLPTIWPAPLVHAFRQVKEAFDPAGILNPGVILPLEGQDPLDGIGSGFPPG